VAGFLSAHERGEPVGLRTSGTSGGARLVVRSTASWVVSFPHVSALTGLDRSARVWVPGPLSATMNLFAAVHTRFVGATCLRDPDHPTHAQLTPSTLSRALDDGVPLDGVHVIVAGDRLTTALHDRASSAGAAVSHYYGAAELSFVAWGSHEGNLQPFPEVEVQVRSGLIWVRSPYLCRGYAGPDGPLRLERDGFATVGDRGTLTAGTLLVTGRGDQVILTGGATVQAADVESVLRAHATGEVAVVGVPHAGLGAVVAAVLTEEADLAGLRGVARATLDHAQRPRLWFHLRRLPLTATGKVDRVALADLLGSPDEVARRLP
jgi:acyl-CoA synthetase (AMP-forming)/AMP-acid ligase II